jgi:hypothetical protein
VIQSELGRKGMIYSGPNYWLSQVGDTDQFAIAGVPLWQVKYNKSGSDPTQAAPPMITDSSKSAWTPSLWQWSGGGDFAYYNQQYGKIPGIAGGIADVDRVMGDDSLLRALACAAAANTATPPPPATSSLATLPTVDLSARRGETSTTVARVQGLLLSRGFGPNGLVSNKTGRPDGLFGSATATALSQFKSTVGLPADTIVDQETWQLLVTDGLD